jgi:hypothetical protein
MTFEYKLGRLSLSYLDELRYQLQYKIIDHMAKDYTWCMIVNAVIYNSIKEEIYHSIGFSFEGNKLTSAYYTYAGIKIIVDDSLNDNEFKLFKECDEAEYILIGKNLEETYLKK